MFGPNRRFPLRGLALVAIGFLLASAFAGSSPAAGAAAGLGVVLFLPLLMLKMFFIFFVFSSMLRFAGGWGPRPEWHHRGPHTQRDWAQRDWAPRTEPRDPAADREQKDWEEALRLAREEVRKYDNSTYPPTDGFDAPAEETDNRGDSGQGQDS